MKRAYPALAVIAAVLVLVALWIARRTAPDEPAAGATTTGSTPAGGRAPVEVDVEWARRLGLAVEPAREEDAVQVARAAATVVPDESRIVHIHTRVAGWVDQVHVQTGEQVRAGQPVLSVFSQELHAAQREYLAVYARRAGSLPSAVLPSSRERLRVLGMSAGQIRALEARGTAPRAITLHAPHAGVVLRRPVSPGTSVDASTELLTLADLSSVWVEAEIAERDALMAQSGAPVRIHWAAAGLEPVDTRLSFVSPVITERSRSIRVRAPLPNPSGLFRPGLSGTLELQGEPRRQVTVPRDAVVDTGRERFVYVVQPDGRFVPRAVTLGARVGDRVAIADGLRAGEPVLASGVFLVDSESRLRGSGTGSLHAGHGTTMPARRGEAPRGHEPPVDHSGHRDASEPRDAAPVGSPAARGHDRHGAAPDRDAVPPTPEASTHTGH